ncbi:hypothetical protein JVT61DRAFT_11892 [Boletus reticuloceps]|uniref:Uncharacterized protein n=1 Tax=Boletus reticuloceps TaxID=495285 RepID=A0A8I2YYQ0_9AGAM|nr:hypothetical protein JVT61DRAFT_11892 [Boletus reticuloceps]
MHACGLSFADAGNMTGQNEIPGPSKISGHRHGKTPRDSEDLPAPKRQKVSEKGKRTDRRAAGGLSRYLDLEAQVSEGEEDDQEEEETNPFVVPDGEDLDELAAGPSSLPSKPHAAYPVAGPSRYTQAVDTIFRCYAPLVEEEWEEEAAAEDDDVEVLDVIGLWKSVGDWLGGALTFDRLICVLDFQHGKYAKIGYWEDLVMELAFENDLGELTAYDPASVPSLKARSPTPKSPSRSSPPLNSAGQTSSWLVRIVPADAAKFIAAVWSKVQLTASMVEGLRGRVVVRAPDPRTFLKHLPPSHIDCVQSFTLVPPEECILPLRLFEEMRVIPAWCVITKRGRYHGDLGYVFSFNSENGLFDILAASRELRPLPHHDNDEMISEDTNDRRLFSSQKYAGKGCASVHGHPTYAFKQYRYVAGLLFIQLPEHKFAHPPPHHLTRSPFMSSLGSICCL